MTTPHRRRLSIGIAAACLALAAGAAAAREVLPRPGDVALDPPNLSERLAHDDALAYRRSLANAKPLTLNQQAYDVRTYDLDLRPDPATRVLTGTVRMTATVTAGPLATLDLDLDDANMVVDEARSAGLPVAFAHGGGVLALQLDRAYDTGETVDVTVRYHGTPGAGAFGAAFVFSTHNGLPFISSLSEPFDARTWWPCKDDPSDKADSVDVRVTVPAGMITAGNGRLVEAYDNGLVSYAHWHERHPIATYLVSIASHPYTVVTDWYRPTATDSMELRFHLFPESVGPTAAVHARVNQMIGTFAGRFGPYPFLDEKYGHAQVLRGGGMENQTCASLGSFEEYLVAHELAHQWWGDAVTCRDFHHIWLNEGFATLAEALWAEANGGVAAYRAYMNALAYYGPGTVYVPDLSDPFRVFDYNLTYRKGAWVLHMLRRVMGDAAFFGAIRDYRRATDGGTAVTEDLQAACEAASGLDLSKFFQQWVYGEGYPEYRISSSWGDAPGGGYDVSVELRQAQAGAAFRMPVDVRVDTPSGAFDFVAHDSLAQQAFLFHVPDVPTAVTLDPDQWLLRTVSATALVEAPAPRMPGLELASPRPNPMRGEAVVEFALPRAGAVELEVVDVTGRRVANLFRGDMPAGGHRVTWSGRDDAGRALGAGVYWLRLTCGGERRDRRVAILR